MATYSPIIIARFWSKVDVKKEVSDCWEWTASTAGGYGRIKNKGVTLRSNRLCWEIFHSKELGNLQALHKCDNKLCCNPYHIYAGTPSENMIDRNMRSGRTCDILTPADVVSVRLRVAEGEKAAEIADEYGVARSTIVKAVSGRSWSCVS